MRLLRKSMSNVARVSDLVCNYKIKCSKLEGSWLVDFLMAIESKFCCVLNFSSMLSGEPRVLKDFIDVDSGSLVFIKHPKQQVFALVADWLPDGAMEAELFLTDVLGSGFPVSPGEGNTRAD